MVEPNPADNGFINAKRSLCFLWDSLPDLQGTIDRNTEVWKKLMAQKQEASEATRVDAMRIDETRDDEVPTVSLTSRKRN